MYAILLQIYLLSTQISAEGELVECENDKIIDVAFVGAPTDTEDAIAAMQLVVNFLNTVVLTGGWRMEVRLLPAANDSELLQDVSGAGLYQIADSMDSKCVEAIVGPGSSTSAKLMHPYAVKSDIPHILPFATDPALKQKKRFPLVIRLSPPDTYQTKAVLDILQFYGWERLSIVTTDNDYGFGVEDSLIELAATRSIKLEVVKRLKTEKGAYMEEISEMLDQLLEANSHPIAVATNLDAASHLLQQAFLKGMIVSRNWVWILLDGVIDPAVFHVKYTADFDDQRRANFNGLIGTRPATSEGNLLTDLKHFWKDANPERDWPFHNGFGFGLEKYIDGLVSIAHGFENDRQKVPELTGPPKIKGLELRSAILRVNTTGLTTPMVFDSDGKINSTKYDILLSSDGKWKVVGEWRSITKLNVSSMLFLNFSQSIRTAGKGTRGPMKKHKRLRTANNLERNYVGKPIVHVVTILESPFVMLGNGSYQSEKLINRVYNESISPSDWKRGMDVELHGYCIDMLQKISENAGIRYTLRLVSDSNYGGYIEDSNDWNGLIGDLRRGESHAAVAPITVTAERSGVVEFSTAFMDVGLKFIINSSAVTKLSHQRDDSSNAFGFLLPFEDSLYYAIALCVICLALFLNFLSRVSPYGARGHFFLGPRMERLRKKVSDYNLTRRSLSVRKSSTRTRTPRDVQRLHAERDDAETRMGINNALYFVWASLFWQTPEAVPRAPSARILTAVWYLSAVVFVASYTAKMVAFVSSHNIEGGIWNSVSGLISQTRVEYGTVSDSSVEFIFQSSAIKMANSIYNYLRSDPSRLLVPTSAAGIERVKNGSYAFIWDSLVLDFEAYRSDCRLRTIDVGFGDVTYAIAFPKNSPLKTIFSRNILRLKESGYLATLWQRYFSEIDKCNQVRSNQDMNFRRLEFEDLAGIFYLVAFAMVLGFLLLTMEWIWAAIQDVDQSTIMAPKSISAALKIRLKRLKQDIAENWIPKKNVKPCYNQWAIQRKRDYTSTLKSILTKFL